MIIRHQASRRLKEDGVDQWQGHEPSKETFLHDIKHHQSYVMMNEKKDIVSIASLCLSNEEAYKNLVDVNIEAVTIHRIAVHDDFLLRGITRIWFEYVFQLAKNLNKKRVYIDTHPQNKRMLSLIRNNDFQYVGQFEFKHLPSPIRLLFMKTILS